MKPATTAKVRHEDEAVVGQLAAASLQPQHNGSEVRAAAPSVQLQDLDLTPRPKATKGAEDAKVEAEGPVRRHGGKALLLVLGGLIGAGLRGGIPRRTPQGAPQGAPKAPPATPPPAKKTRKPQRPALPRR